MWLMRPVRVRTRGGRGVYDVAQRFARSSVNWLHKRALAHGVTGTLQASLQRMTSHFAHRGTLSLAAAVVTSVFAALALASTDPTTQEEERAAPALEACGAPGAVPCPLQAWMRANVASPLASNKMASLADGLERAARLSPEAGWGSWSTFATQGAQAARRGDVAGARASCKGCHDAWRDAYRAKYRARPVPR
jgi:hypothetical protein